MTTPAKWCLRFARRALCAGLTLCVSGALCLSTARASEALQADSFWRYRVPADAFAEVAGRQESTRHRAPLGVAWRAESAQRATELPFSPRFVRIAFDDTLHVLSAPARWDATDWRKAAWAGAAIVGTALVLDRPLRRAFNPNRISDDRTLREFERFGERNRIFPMLGGFYVYGVLADDDTAQRVALDGLIASYIAASLVTPNLKRVFGRGRPRNGQGFDHFEAFGPYRAFPSGHATEAFALAGTLAAHYDRPWVKVLAYGTATLVGVARMEHEQHWASDVLAGALIGSLIAREVVQHNHALRSPSSRWRPELGSDGTQITLTWAFD